MGSPSVFQTAPPQPASKARMTWSPQLAGGPEASQKGLGQRIPAKLVVRSAMIRLGTQIGDLRYLDHPLGGSFSVCYGVHYFAASVYAIASGVVFRVAGSAGGSIHYDGSVFQLDATGGLQQVGQARLSQRWNDGVAGEIEFGTGDCDRGTPAGRVGLGE